MGEFVDIGIMKRRYSKRIVHKLQLSLQIIKKKKKKSKQNYSLFDFTFLICWNFLDDLESFFCIHFPSSPSVLILCVSSSEHRFLPQSQETHKEKSFYIFLQVLLILESLGRFHQKLRLILRFFGVFALFFVLISLNSVSWK